MSKFRRKSKSRYGDRKSKTDNNWFGNKTYQGQNYPSKNNQEQGNVLLDSKDRNLDK